MLACVSKSARTIPHLVACERKLAVLDRAEATDIAVDLHVVGRIGEHEVGLAPVHQCLEVGSAARVPAQQAMPTKLPQITLPRD